MRFAKTHPVQLRVQRISVQFRIGTRSAAFQLSFDGNGALPEFRGPRPVAKTAASLTDALDDDVPHLTLPQIQLQPLRALTSGYPPHLEEARRYMAWIAKSI